MKTLQTKFNSKKELYDFLVRDGKCYLPPNDLTNISFFRDVFSGKKKVSYS